MAAVSNTSDSNNDNNNDKIPIIGSQTPCTVSPEDKKWFEHRDLYLNNEVLSHEHRKKIEKEIIALLKTKPYIHAVWRYKTLQKMCPNPDSFEEYYKNQLYPGRSGNIIIHINPYCLITNYAVGAAHETPYADNTHIPLVFYQKAFFKPHHIIEKVYGQQFANSLAFLLNVPQTSSSLGRILPGLQSNIFEK